MRKTTFLVGLVLALSVSLTTLAANRVEIENAGAVYWPWDSCSRAIVRIHIQNDVDLESFSLPLVARSSGGGAFWAAPIDTIPSSGRLSGSLSGIRSLETGRADFVTPDPFLLYYRASDPSDCLSAGSSEIMLGFTCGVVSYGLIEIDTLSYSPCFQPMFFSCADGTPVAIDEFVKGLINVNYLPFDFCLGLVEPGFDSTSLTAWAGDSLQNQTIFYDVMLVPKRYRITQGPGQVDSMTGLWTWKSSPSDSGVHSVSIAVRASGCPVEECTPQSFTVTLKALVPGDLNCDGIANVVDVVLEVGRTFRNDTLPTPCWGL